MTNQQLSWWWGGPHHGERFEKTVAKICLSQSFVSDDTFLVMIATLVSFKVTKVALRGTNSTDVTSCTEMLWQTFRIEFRQPIGHGGISNVFRYRSVCFNIGMIQKTVSLRNSVTLSVEHFNYNKCVGLCSPRLSERRFLIKSTHTLLLYYQMVLTLEINSIVRFNKLTCVTKVSVRDLLLYHQTFSIDIEWLKRLLLFHVRTQQPLIASIPVQAILLSFSWTTRLAWVYGSERLRLTYVRYHLQIWCWTWCL